MLALQTAARSLQGVERLAAARRQLDQPPAPRPRPPPVAALAGSVTFAVQHLASANVMATGQSVASTSSVIAQRSRSSSPPAATRSVCVPSPATPRCPLATHTIAVTQASERGRGHRHGSCAVHHHRRRRQRHVQPLSSTARSSRYQLAAGTYSLGRARRCHRDRLGRRSQGDRRPRHRRPQGLDRQRGQRLQPADHRRQRPRLRWACRPAASVNGTDGIISVDGTSTTLTNLVPGASVTLPSGNGGTRQRGARRASGGRLDERARRCRSATARSSTVVSAINAANQGVSASAIRIGDNAYRLQLSSTDHRRQRADQRRRLGLCRRGRPDTASRPGADALLHVGGTDGFDVTSSTNTITGLMPGVNVTLTGATLPAAPSPSSAPPTPAAWPTRSTPSSPPPTPCSTS